MAKGFLLFASASGALSVMAGAFGAHVLRDRLDEYLFGVYQTAVQYQVWHTLALLAVGLWCLLGGATPALRFSGYAFMAGIVLFSGSLYALCFSGVKALGMITPVGGFIFIAAWCALFVAAWRLHTS
ncbi:MAG: hypothetical protein CSA53_00620 [Gammaproteobacteria bacterium]|nr:MAG: hypothetical protein CSA53_00620 [Gammaproteobacteria bacterium]